MPNDYFQFKQFKILQNKCLMKVGTDAVLLGAWIDTSNYKTILDIGTGTGVIALMIAQKSNGIITAIEIHKDSCFQAKVNFSKSLFSDKILSKHISFQEFYNTNSKKFDLIVSNPPYFINSLKSKKIGQNLSKHNDLLSFEDLLLGVLKLLNKNGKFCLILPKNEALIFNKMAHINGLFLTKLLRVKTRNDDVSEKRHLMQFEFSKTEYSESTLIIEENSHRNYTKEYKDFTKDYYLNF